MYAAIWRILPGQAWLKAILALLLVAAVVVALMWFVFPWVSQFLTPDQEVTVQ